MSTNNLDNAQKLWLPQAEQDIKDAQNGVLLSYDFESRYYSTWSKKITDNFAISARSNYFSLYYNNGKEFVDLVVIDPRSTRKVNYYDYPLFEYVQKKLRTYGNDCLDINFVADVLSSACVKNPVLINLLNNNMLDDFTNNNIDIFDVIQNKFTHKIHNDLHSTNITQQQIDILASKSKYIADHCYQLGTSYISYKNSNHQDTTLLQRNLNNIKDTFEYNFKDALCLGD